MEREWGGQERASDTALDVIIENGHGGGQLFSTSRTRLPITLGGFEPSKLCTVGSNMKIPNKTSSPTEFQEERVVLSLIEDLQVGLALDLDEAPCMNRSPGPPESTGKDVFLVVGSSNARRLAAAMEKKGWQTGYLLSDSWRATKKSVSDMATHILEEKDKRKYTAIIFMLLDNNMFFGQSEDGSRGLPKKEADGRYHAEGVIHLADKDGQYAILKLCKPIWETAKDLNMVIISPMARYVTAGCCDNPGHMSNRGKPDFYHQMKLDLVGCAQNIKNFLFTGGLRNGRVMDPGRTTRDLAAERSGETTPSTQETVSTTELRPGG